MFFKCFATCLVARASKEQGVVKVRLGRAGEGARELFPWTAGPGTHKYFDPEHPVGAGTTCAGRHNAAASKSARSPSLRLPQPRVPPASACCGRRTRTTLLKRLPPRHSPQRRQFDTRHNGSTAENAAAGRGNPGVFVGDAHSLRLLSA